MKVFFLFFFCVASLTAAEPTDFIQVIEHENRSQLQTSITTYTRGKSKVSLIGAIHIGDADYYQKLNEEFRQYSSLLFELIGGETTAQFLDGKPRAHDQPIGDTVKGLHQLYGSFAKTMQLVQQVDLIDYTPPNFIHADLTMAEYTALTADNDEDLLAFSLESSIKTTEITGKPFGGIDMRLMMRAILSGDGTGLKLALMTSMSQGDESAAAMTGQNLIIKDRNAKCFQILDEQLVKGAENIGIFYGAAHFPDMEARLLEKGFAKTQHRWITAWDVKRPEGKPK